MEALVINQTAGLVDDYEREDSPACALREPDSAHGNRKVCIHVAD